MPGYLAICAIYQNEASYLREWIEFHALVGIERFFLYDHESTDGSEELLAPYVAEGLVVNRYWPVDPGQMEAYDDCVAEHGSDWRWIAFIDLDEFLFSPKGAPVPEVLRRFEHVPGVGVPWAVFGTSGHKARPHGLVIENYTMRANRPRRPTQFKSIVDPRRVVRARGPHVFIYQDRASFETVPRFVTFDELRVNHYWTKSEEELVAKLSKVRADTGGDPLIPAERALEVTREGVHDGAILQYAPGVREALAAREAAPKA